MAFLMVDGVEIKTPSSFSVQIYDESLPDSGRTLDGIMHKNTLCTKRTISLAWDMPTPAEARAILNAFMTNEYFSVTYFDPQYGEVQQTKTFYVGDREAPMKQWFVGGRLWEQISFNIIER